jgi:hypothetical protein
VAEAQERRWVRTARTRRWSSAAGSSSSLPPPGFQTAEPGAEPFVGSPHAVVLDFQHQPAAVGSRYLNLVMTIPLQSVTTGSATEMTTALVDLISIAEVTLRADWRAKGKYAKEHMRKHGQFAGYISAIQRRIAELRKEGKAATKVEITCTTSRARRPIRRRLSS